MARGAGLRQQHMVRDMKIVGGKWSNWSGGVTCKPKEIVAPKDDVALAAAVRTAEGTVRVPGSGHSFTPICDSDGTLIDMAAFAGLKNVDEAAQVATMGAATPLWQAGPLLHAAGFGFKNMGDIDRQTLGGVVGTGTHGTGATLGSFSADVAGFQLLLASGEVLNCTPQDNTEIFEAGRMSLGSMGVMTEISMHVRPAYKLVEKNFMLPVDELFTQLDELVTKNRHFEFFWFPYANRAICKTLNETTDDAPNVHSAEEMFARGEGGGADMALFTWLNEILPYAPFLLRPIHKLFSQFMAAPPRVRWSNEAFPSPRNVRFNEMEYAVPIEKGPDCIREVVETIRKKRSIPAFPSNTAQLRPMMCGLVRFTNVQVRRLPCTNTTRSIQPNCSRLPRQSSVNMKAARIGASETRARQKSFLHYILNLSGFVCCGAMIPNPVPNAYLRSIFVNPVFCLMAAGTQWTSLDCRFVYADRRGRRTVVAEDNLPPPRYGGIVGLMCAVIVFAFPRDNDYPPDGDGLLGR